MQKGKEEMGVFERNQSQILKLMNWAILGHIPVFWAMADYFGTEKSIAVIFPLLLFAGQMFWGKILKNENVASLLMGFSSIALSGIMIHLGKGMIEWHFHIFVTIGILSLLANPKTTIVAAVTGAVHHLAFWYWIPESIFNYEASFGIVAIHALFVVFETIACAFLAYKFKASLDLQQKISLELSPLVGKIDSVSKNTMQSCTVLLNNSNANSNSITEISASSEEINQMVNSTKNQITKSFNLMEETQESMRISSQAIERSQEFFQKLEDISKSMDKLQLHSEQNLRSVETAVNNISDKTSVINDIVFQTKLLSFNASVEAARAGEHGKGFSVVAEEISILANNSGQASDEIGKIVTASKSSLSSAITDIVKQITAFKAEIQEAYDVFNQTNSQLNSSFKKLSENTSIQKDYLKEVLDATQSQSEGIKELSAALSTISTSSGESLSHLKEVETLIGNLDQESRRLSYINSSLSKSGQDEEDEFENDYKIAS